LLLSALQTGDIGGPLRARCGAVQQAPTLDSNGAAVVPGNRRRAPPPPPLSCQVDTSR